MAAAARKPKQQKPQPEQPQLALFNGFPVTIEIFEGPLDLLLHLVRREEVDVAEISVASITAQYLAYIRTMQDLNIQFAADFVVMAATLMLIKSRWLLPIDPAGEVGEEEAIEVAVDPEAELHRRLQEYKLYREAAEMLEESHRERQRIFLRSGDEAEIGTGFVNLEDVSVFDMIAAVQEMLARAKPEPPSKVRRAAMSVGDRLEEIILQLTAERRAINFSELVIGQATRLFIIVTFLAILELIRRRRIRVSTDPKLRDFAVELVH
ncbi:MAG: segregation/condensation protein A [Armatimonadia bacterium]